MKSVVYAVVAAAVLGAGATAQQASQPAKPAPTAIKPAAAHPPVAPAGEAQTKLVKQYCAGCHSEQGKSGGLSLAGFDVAKADKNAEVAEKMIRKLRAGMMPPPGARRPDAAALGDLVDTLETKIDTVAALNPNPGWRPFQRLNRAEYSRAVQD